MYAAVSTKIIHMIFFYGKKMPLHDHISLLGNNTICDIIIFVKEKFLIVLENLQLLISVDVM